MSQELQNQEIIDAAQAGDKDAMYKLAALLSASGQKKDAIQWLQKAAAEGQLDARFTLASFLLKGVNVPRDVKNGIAVLQSAATNNHAASVHMYLVLQAAGHGMDRDWTSAIDILLEASLEGASIFMRELAYLLILAGKEDDLVHELLLCAASKADFLAGVALCIRHIEGDKRVPVELARKFAKDAMAKGYPSAAEYLDALGGDGDVADLEVQDTPALDKEKIQKAIKGLETGELGVPETILDRPNIRVHKAAVPSVICDHLIAIAYPRLQIAMEMSPNGQDWVPHSLNKATMCTYWPDDMDLITYVVGVLMMKAAGQPVEHGEMLHVMAYEPGQQYLPHYDFIPSEMPNGQQSIDKFGQRLSSVNLYLNDDYEDGETKFDRADYEHKGGKGDILVLSNTLEDGETDEQALYSEKLVRKGVKWVVNRLVRDKAFQQIG